MNKSLINKMLDQIDIFSYPNNPRNKKKEKKDAKYFHLSNHYFEGVDDAGVKTIRRVGITYRREVPKPLSKRDMHRNKGN